MKKKNNVNKRNDEELEEYFVGMLLAASQNDLKKIEIADVWNIKKNKNDIYYRTSGFSKEWNLKKSVRMPFRFYYDYRDIIEKTRKIFKDMGINVPDVEYTCVDI